MRLGRQLRSIAVCSGACFAATLALAPQQPSGMGVSSGKIAPPLLDEEDRPVTIGGTVRSGPRVFEDGAVRAKLAEWHHQMGTAEKKFILETNGSGVALLDFDNDGWMDIYLVNGSTFEANLGKEAAPRAALFHNNHDGTFTDVSAKAGVTNDRWGFGAAVADFDNDGWPDLYVSNFGKNRLFHNNRDGTFTDIAEKAGVQLGNWSTGATWGDFDGDGQLDLFVPGYVHYDTAHPPVPGSASVSMQVCQYRGVPEMCGPLGLRGEPDHLFRNNGDLTFTDVSESAGVADHGRFYGLASLFADVNGDGWPDLIVANDSTPNYLYLNNGDGTFVDASYESGYAVNGEGRETASMGIAFGDYVHTGFLSLYDTVFSDDYNPLFRNDGTGHFTDVSEASPEAKMTVPFLGWGVSFLDFDNDGWLDLLIANGHVYRNADSADWGTTWKQRPLLFGNQHGHLTLVPAVEGTALSVPLAARGLAVGDLMNNGRLGVVINNLDGAPSLFINVVKSANHWLELRLVGGPCSPRDAIGATATLSAAGVQQRADVLSGGSYASSSDPRLHFGLGVASQVDDLKIHWPDGQITHDHVAAIDTILTVREKADGTCTTRRQKRKP